jgi:hypothetical protein
LILSVFLSAAACNRRSVRSDEDIQKYWVGQHINKAIDRLGTPDRVVPYPEGIKYYYFRFAEEVGDIHIFQRDPDFDGSTIRIQEQIARADQSRCSCRIEVKDEIIQHIDLAGKGCITVQKKLEM